MKEPKNKKLRLDGLAISGAIALLIASGAGAQEQNKLSAQETQARYNLLFNGKDLSNWHAYRQTTVTDAWSVKTTAPLGARIENGTGTFLPILSGIKFKNFDLKIDVQTPAGGNSGIFTRYEETALSSGNARSGPEFQICGPNHNDCIEKEKQFGASYDMFAVKESIRPNWFNPSGTWNQIRIIAFDSNYVHYGNGKKLLEYKIGTADYLKAYNASKYADDGNNGRYYDIHAGGILLQHHTETGITFRNIKAKELGIHPFLKDFKETGKWPEELSQEAVLWDTVVTVGIAGKRQSDPIAFSTAFDGSGAIRIQIDSKHEGFQTMGIDGRAIAHRKLASGTYSIGKTDGASGIVILRVRAGGQSQTHIVNLP
jgi:hypothetical protein